MSTMKITVQNVDQVEVMMSERGAQMFERWVSHTSNSLIVRALERINAAPVWQQQRFFVECCAKAARAELAMRGKHNVIIL